MGFITIVRLRSRWLGGPAKIGRLCKEIKRGIEHVSRKLQAPWEFFTHALGKNVNPSYAVAFIFLAPHAAEPSSGAQQQWESVISCD